MVKHEEPRLRLSRGRIVLLVAMVLSAACDVFSPRDSELPAVSVPDDPLNFSAIMAGTGYQFSTPRYEDIFSNDAHYKNIYTTVFPKDRLIQRLLQIQRQLLDQNIEVAWSGGEIIPRDDTIYINEITYRIPSDSGRSNFVIVRDKQWRISRWLDSPAQEGKSLFSP